MIFKMTFELVSVLQDPFLTMGFRHGHSRPLTVAKASLRG